MRARVVLVWTLMCVVPAAVVQACGGKDDGADSTATGQDAAPDVVAQADATADATKTEDCDPQADFTTKIPDASIADGASSTGTCMACVNANCKSAVTKCNENCLCQGVADDALACFLQNPTNPLSCASSLGGALSDTEARSAALGILTCANTACQEQCAIGAYLPQDGGSDADAN